MYAKVFYQIFESSIAEDYIVRHVFMDLLVLADDEGVIDKTDTAISRITNVPVDIVRMAIRRLCQPDLDSRSIEEDGRRLMLVDSHRNWGWRIVNYAKYRTIRDEEARRIANRSYKREQRAKQKIPPSPPEQLEIPSPPPDNAHREEHIQSALQFFATGTAVTNQRVLKKLEDPMRARMKELDTGAYEVASEMADIWFKYLRHPGRLGKPMSMVTFFTQGYWLNVDSWVILMVAS
jgi:hypothetical protein